MWEQNQRRRNNEVFHIEHLSVPSQRFKPQVAQAHVAREGCNLIYIT